MKISREKAALGFFIVLALAALAIAVVYIVGASRSLNMAASTIDDATGNLDDYTALIYVGQATDNKEALVDITHNGRLMPRGLGEQSNQQPSQSHEDEVSASDVASASDDEDAADQVSVFAVQNSYLDKQAHVVVLDVQHPLIYNEKTVIRAGKYTFGIVSLDAISAQPAYLNKRVKEYKQCEVDFVVCIVSDVALLKEYKGVDIVISTQNEGLAAQGVLLDKVFYDDAALEGQVGTILISPSRTITAKDASSA